MSPLVKKAFRARGIRRERVRPNAAGNFITSHKFNKVWWIGFPRTEQHYINWDGYIPPYPQPIGYVFPPPPAWPWRLLQSQTSPNAYNTISDVPEPYHPVEPPTPPGLPYPPTSPVPPAPPPGPIPLPPIVFPSPPQKPPTSPAPGIPPDRAGLVMSIPVPAPDFRADTIDVGTTPRRLAQNTINIRSILLFSLPSNTANILFFSNRDMVHKGTLEPGMGVVLEIDDVSDVWVMATAAGQKLTIAYELADYSGIVAGG